MTKTEDLVTALRNVAAYQAGRVEDGPSIYTRAADEIERLRRALEQAAKIVEAPDTKVTTSTFVVGGETLADPNGRTRFVSTHDASALLLSRAAAIRSLIPAEEAPKPEPAIDIYELDRLAVIQFFSKLLTSQRQDIARKLGASQGVLDEIGDSHGMWNHFLRSIRVEGKADQFAILVTQAVAQEEKHG